MKVSQHSYYFPLRLTSYESTCLGFQRNKKTSWKIFTKKKKKRKSYEKYKIKWTHRKDNSICSKIAYKYGREPHFSVFACIHYVLCPFYSFGIFSLMWSTTESVKGHLVSFSCQWFKPIYSTYNNVNVIRLLYGFEKKKKE